MNKVMMFALAVLLAGCKPAPPADTVESLTTDPERIKEVRRLCREERSKVTDELCLRAAEAANRRFFGDLPEQGGK
ncbi:EexN family lipoprotein [Parapusillimonas granuli]|uniref:EexN family lipoprotein n=1 Tax=Parapusillimonas granuli TaxID=380911 RepID=A0A853G291_9BURK|nr:EexN family lipoprotein [Parapusillimonas granuli]MBB5213976.1 signal transduction histidine kinase [Parapusillimonas granuli]NYT50397.1 EexN family lipoprotein [Parapusillimonas granuli]